MFTCDALGDQKRMMTPSGYPKWIPGTDLHFVTVAVVVIVVVFICLLFVRFLFFLAYLTQTKHNEKHEPQLKSYLHYIVCGLVHGALSSLLKDVRGPAYCE